MPTPRVIWSLIALLFSAAVASWCLLAPPLPAESGKQVAPAEKEPRPAPAGMAWIPGGKFLMGSRDGQEDEKPVHEAELAGYWIDTTEVTNAEFQRFVDATSYVTLAEKTPTREDFAGQVDPSLIADEDLVAGSICFNPNFDRELVRRIRHPSNPDWAHAVWRIQEGANWRHPHGPDSNIDDKRDHPVVHVAWPDAVAYCRWAGKRLPTEAEFELAARGGRRQQEYPWGDELQEGDRWRANLWQGEFPEEHDVQDGHRFTASVKSFPPNGYGLYDIVGNVWEWCADWYQPAYYSVSPRRDPRGPRDSFDPNEPKIPKRVQRGGSFMCNDNYCRGYRCATRMKGDVNSSSFHCGFRAALSPSDYDAFAKATAQQTATNR